MCFQPSIASRHNHTWWLLTKTTKFLPCIELALFLKRLPGKRLCQSMTPYACAMVVSSRHLWWRHRLMCMHLTHMAQKISPQVHDSTGILPAMLTKLNLSWKTLFARVISLITVNDFHRFRHWWLLLGRIWSTTSIFGSASIQPKTNTVQRLTSLWSSMPL